MSERRHRQLVVGIFVLSGAAGLIYEVVWARQLVLVFGNTTQAVSAILTGFFGGMAVGSLVGGRLADRVRSPLRVYALIEGALVVVVLLTPLLFGALTGLYRGFYGPVQEQPGLLALTKFGLAILALAPATILMGATLPMLTRHLTVSHAELARQFGRLYAANTFGGILGTAVSGYLLIELVGLMATLVTGAALSMAAALSALVLARRSSRVLAGEPAMAKDPQSVGPTMAPRWLILLIAFVSGLTSLGYQVLWTRLLSSGTDNASYVFTTILVLFLAGIAIGARFHGLGVGRRLGRLELLGITQLLVATIAVLGVGIMGNADVGRARFVLVLLATVVMGFALPIAAGLLGRQDRHVGGDTGLLLAVNTAGVVVGTFVVPFALIPVIGSIHSVLLLGGANAALGSVLVLRRGPSLRGRVAGVAGSGLLAVALIGPLINPSMVQYPHASAVARSGQLFASAEDEIAAVEAGSVAHSPRLWVAGLSMTSLTVDAKLMPLLPLMTRTESKSALVVAFGMGTSFRTALIAGLETEVVELVPSVPEMFQYYYPDAKDVLANPRGHLVIADGRNDVELTQHRYDMIVVDPPPPIRSAGTGVLYSLEFYHAAAARLTQNGVMMEWMPYDQSIEEFRAHMRTFMTIFPNSIYVLSPADHGVFMLGSKGPIALEDESIRKVLERPGVIDDLASAPDSVGKTVAFWADRIPDLIWTSGAQAQAFAGDAPIITDDRPYTEYFLLRDTFGQPSPEMRRQNLIAALEAFASAR